MKFKVERTIQLHVEDVVEIEASSPVEAQEIAYQDTVDDGDLMERCKSSLDITCIVWTTRFVVHPTLTANRWYVLDTKTNKRSYSYSFYDDALKYATNCESHLDEFRAKTT